MSNKIYFPGLNGIRAIAAILVVLSHISLCANSAGLGNGRGIDMAGYGVTMFFVLSGYLITFLLLKEYEKKGGISYKKFYMRRILRIWPIYYLSLAIAYVINVAHGGSIPTSSLLFFLFFMPNVPYVFGGSIHLISQLWSVGVEEQFYLFWPWLFKSRKKLYAIMWGLIIFFLVLKLILRVYENGNWYIFLYATRFQCMAIGGIGAYNVLNNNQWLKTLYSIPLQILCWVILAVSLYKPFHIQSFIDNEIYAIIFLIIIINVSTNPATLISLENRVFNWLGSISYGIYVYHMFAISIVLSVSSYLRPHHLGGLVLLYGAVIALTLAMAHVSFYYFERQFLKKKDKYMVVASTNKPSEEIKPEFTVKSLADKSSPIL